MLHLVYVRMSKKSWNKSTMGPGSNSSFRLKLDFPEDPPHYLIRQMKDLREPIHILMDCWPSFLTVPVFKSRIRPKGRSKNQMLLPHESLHQRRHQVTGEETGKTQASPMVPLDAFSGGAAGSLLERHQGLVPSTKGRFQSKSSAGFHAARPHHSLPRLLYLSVCSPTWRAAPSACPRRPGAPGRTACCQTTPTAAGSGRESQSRRHRPPSRSRRTL